MNPFVIPFRQISNNQVDIVGGKNASLGEMIQQLAPMGINVPDGFATTSEAYWYFLDENGLREEITEILSHLDLENFSNLSRVGEKIRALVMHANVPEKLRDQILEAYKTLKQAYTENIQVAVRSSATAEDLPEASFAGQQESYLNIGNEEELMEAVISCYASLFTNRAIKYRVDNGFEHMDVALSIGVQKMVRSDKASAGVSFTLDPESGFRNVILITAGYGLGENVVKGSISPDEYLVFKPTLQKNKFPILSRCLGEKEMTLIYSESKVPVKHNLEAKLMNIETPLEKRKSFVLSDEEVILLARWSQMIEDHYERPMDIEWAKDGLTDEMYIVQARPETVFGVKESFQFIDYKLKEKGEVLCTGKNVGTKIAAGKVKVLDSPREIDKLKQGEILVTQITNPDWDPILKKASAIITNKGGRTSHAAIVARETGAVAVVGTGNATEVLHDGQEVTVSCAEGDKGVIYEGILDWEEHVIDTENIRSPKTNPMLILADPEQAFRLANLPNRGVGLLRLEFVINNSIQIHPMALVNFDQVKDKNIRAKITEITHGYSNKKQFFIDKLAQAVGIIAAAFYPNDVIVRMSDFKTNEYANLIGGKYFEPDEENPMIGWRGASRYHHDKYKDGFALECAAMKRVRDEWGLTNVKLMIPFCRTLSEARSVIRLMHDHGLVQGKNKLQLYMMVEIPSNVILAEEFADLFDGFSIGSNDLTQLTLGIDRDSELLSDSFDPQDLAIKRSLKSVITTANEKRIPIGLCGQAPSDFPEFAQFLVESGINSISFSPDALLKGIENINKAETANSTKKREEVLLAH